MPGGEPGPSVEVVPGSDARVLAFGRRAEDFGAIECSDEHTTIGFDADGPESAWSAGIFASSILARRGRSGRALRS